MGKNRDTGIDAMRVLAMFGVVFNHSNERGSGLYLTCRPASPAYWIYLFFSVACKTVPLFLMISGAVMLTKDEEPLGILWKKRIWRMLTVLAVTLLIYYLKDIYISGEHFQLHEFLNELYSVGYIHLWYLYAYIAFLICLPLFAVCGYRAH